MTDQEAAEIVAAGSLSAKIIRACPVHRTCPLTCKQRRVEDLGEIANFEMRPSDASLFTRLKEGFSQWLR